MSRIVSYALAALLACAALSSTTSEAQLAPSAHLSLELPSLHLQTRSQSSYVSGGGGTHADVGLVVAGSVMLGVGYLTSATIGLLADNPILLIPVVGGLIHAPVNGTGGGIALGLSVSAVQIVGLVLLIVGAVANIPNEDDEMASLMPQLVPGPGEAGGGLRWRF